MMGQTTRYSDTPCPVCTGTGKNPRNRKKKCEPCHGTGKQIICDNCLQPWPCAGIRPHVIDGCCTLPRAAREEVPPPPMPSVIAFPLFKNGIAPLITSEILAVQPMTMGEPIFKFEYTHEEIPNCPNCHHPVSIGGLMEDGFLDRCDVCFAEYVVRRNPDRAEKRS